MEFITQIRQQLNLSQTELAVILGVSRELISKSEKGLRSFPSHAFNMLMKLSETPSNNFSKSTLSNTRLTSRIQQEVQSTIKDFQKRENICRYQAAGLHMKLDDMCAAYERTLLWHSLLEQRLQELEGTDTSANQLHLLEMHLHKAEMNLIKYCPSERAKLRVKIHVLEAEADMCREIKDKRQKIRDIR